MNLRTRPTRALAVVGAVVATGTAGFMAVAAGTASADEPGRCTQNVNVRQEADVNSRIVAMCEAGTQVTIGPEKDGWAYLENLRGWASRDYIKADPQAEATSDDEDAASPSSSPSSSSASSTPSSTPSEEADGDQAEDEGAGDRTREADEEENSARDTGREVSGLTR